LIVVSAYLLWVLAIEVKRGHEVGYIVLFSMAFTLPYVPLFLTSPPQHKLRLFGKAKGAKPVVNDLGGI
jgi:hypothetical protein